MSHSMDRRVHQKCSATSVGILFLTTAGHGLQ